MPLITELTHLPRKKLYLASSLALMLAACGGNSNNTPENVATPEPAEPTTPVAPVEPVTPVEPTPVVTPVTIRGVANDILPSGALPSASLPSKSLASMSLPTTEFDETPSVAELRSLNIKLQAIQEVGTAIDSSADFTANAEFALNETTGDITATVTAANLAEGDSITMIHIHSGFAGENGGVLAGFESTSDPLVYTLNTNIASLNAIAGNDLATFLDGGWYLNLHTTSNPSGHLRGQVFTHDVDVVRAELKGKQQNPAVSNADGVSGVSYTTLDVDDQSIVVNVSVEGFTPFLDAPVGPVHLHSGFAGENGGVILPLSPVGDSETTYRGTEADIISGESLDFNVLAQGGHYINVHSAANPSGEVRGQIVPRGVDAVRMELQGQQQNPAITNVEGVSGVAYATFNAELGNIVITSAVEGFVPSLDAPVGPVHLHSGFAGENGGVILPLSPVGDSQTQYRGTEADVLAGQTLDFEQLSQGGHYLNIHSAANGSGEVRGQLVPRGVDTVRMELQGQQQNPAVQNADGISGVAYTTFSAEQQSIVINSNVEGFVPFLDAPVGPVHLHSGFAGENGGVILPLSPVGDSQTHYRGTADDIIDGQSLDFDQLAQGGHYLNVHSEANGSGEVRGQIVPRYVEAVRMELQGQQENPAVQNAEGISGVSYATFNSNAETLVLNTTVTGFTPFLNAPVGPVHLHNAYAGTNGPVVLPLSTVGDSDTVFRGTEADVIAGAAIDFDQLKQGAYYINVHSADNAGGEVRGQLIGSNSIAVRAELNGSQALPADDTQASGVGYLTVTDRANGLFLSNVSLIGLEATDVSINVGGANNNELQELTQSADNEDFFSNEIRPVASLNGILNGAYSFNATGTEREPAAAVSESVTSPSQPAAEPAQPEPSTPAASPSYSY